MEILIAIAIAAIINNVISGDSSSSCDDEKQYSDCCSVDSQ